MQQSRKNFLDKMANAKEDLILTAIRKGQNSCKIAHESVVWPCLKQAPLGMCPASPPRPPSAPPLIGWTHSFPYASWLKRLERCSDPDSSHNRWALESLRLKTGVKGRVIKNLCLHTHSFLRIQWFAFLEGSSRNCLPFGRRAGGKEERFSFSLSYYL